MSLMESNTRFLEKGGGVRKGVDIIVNGRVRCVGDGEGMTFDDLWGQAEF